MVRTRRWAVAMLVAVALEGGAQEPASRPDPAAKASEAGTDLRGTLVRVDARTMYLTRDGIVVPVRIDARTQFEGARAKLRDYRPGDRVEVRVEVQNRTDNVARRIAIDETSRAGVGGPGVVPPPIELAHPPKPLESRSGTGGSGAMNYGAEKNSAENGSRAPLADPAPNEQ